MGRGNRRRKRERGGKNNFLSTRSELSVVVREVREGRRREERE